MAGQARTERAWSVISCFYDNCKKHKPRKKGYPRFKKEQTHGSVEYETSGWNLSEKRRYIAVLKKVRYALCPMPYALCPMPYALCPVVPHLSEKGYITFSDCLKPGTFKR